MAKNPTKVVIGIPFYRQIEPQTVLPLIQTMHSGEGRFMWGIDMYGTTNVAEGRNVLVEHFVNNKTDPDVLFFLDSDMYFTPQQVNVVIQSLLDDPETGLVAGLYCRRSAELTPLVGWYHEGTRKPLPMDDQVERLVDGAGKVVEADILPTGFMAIKREVFAKVEKPWFNLDHKGDDGSTRSSDVVFVEKVREAGYKTMAHLGVDLGHIGTAIYTNGQFYANAHMFRSSNQLARIKADLLQEYGPNTKKYWDGLYEAENQLQAIRDYPDLHKPIIAAIQKDWRVADIGSGPGVLAKKLENKTKDVTCFDISEFAIKQCEKQGFEGRVFEIGKEQLFPGDHKAYDCVISTEVIEHLEDPQKLIKMMYSMLKPGGLAIISCPNDCMPPEEEPEHVRTITAVQLAKYMEAFEDKDIMQVKHYLLGMGVKPGASDN